MSLIPAYVRRSYRGELVRSRLASDLDRSELVGLSYALGQAMTAVFCRLELSVAHLLHNDRRMVTVLRVVDLRPLISEQRFRLRGRV